MLKHFATPRHSSILFEFAPRKRPIFGVLVFLVIAIFFTIEILDGSFGSSASGHAAANRSLITGRIQGSLGLLRRRFLNLTTTSEERKIKNTDTRKLSGLLFHANIGKSETH